MVRSLLARSAALLVFAALVAGCGGPGESSDAASEADAPTLFERRAPDSTGVTFSNALAESAALNIVNYLYYYNGGGVAAGDVNGDGRVDLYFTANEEDNALYLNRGGFRFEEATERAGVAGTADWTTGATMADVNGDGHLDIYVTVVNGYKGLEGRNQLFVNDGDGTFTERAAEYGLDLTGYGTQSAFFDYDGDGDLDLFVLNHTTHDEQTYGRARLRTETDAPKAGDKLFRNDGGRFTEVTEEAGIHSSRIGYGLGVSVSDLNRDGCPDVYVANDFHEDDYLYYNNCDGTFREARAEAMRHTSLSSMGSDAADVNNDGRPDVVTLDMLADRESIRKTSAGPESYDVYQIKRRYGYGPQFSQNTLQLNQGGERFSEIGHFAGIQATDWSWAPLLADYDLDGDKDLFVTNGIYRRPNDLDYIQYASQPSVQSALDDLSESDLSVLERMPQVPVPNYAFRNDTGLSFTSTADDWGLDREGFSNGAAYADLDNDGDLDLVVNNINAPASLYENRADALRKGRHTLTVALENDQGANTDGLGATVFVRTDSLRQMQEVMTTRGYQSSVPPRLHFGLGPRRTVDSLTVVWPDGRTETRTGVAADQALTLRYADAEGRYDFPGADTTGRLLAGARAPGLDHRHAENDFNDFSRQYLAPRKVSTEGPALAVGDVNGDGREDVFVGGAKRQAAGLYLQQADGSFRATADSLWRADRLHEDVDATFFDADGDGDLDLYVVSAGNEFWGSADALADRLYLNDGSGTFRRADAALPDGFRTNGGAVAAGDIDGDGDTDLFVGGRVVAREYGRTPTSVLLENDGTGRFSRVTEERAPGLASVGMVTDAVWTDVDTDGRTDLVVAGAWMPVTVFRQQADGTFAEATAEFGLGDTRGWWTALAAGDVDGDGDPDLVAGNLGRNGPLSASPERPVRLYVGDFNDDGRAEPVLTRHRNGTATPIADRDAFLKSIPSLEDKFPTHASFGASTIEEVLPAEALDAATVRHIDTLASTYFENRGGAFAARSLPARAQLAPIHAVHAGDVTGDGTADLVVGGNFHGVKPSQGRYDASYGLVLRGDGAGTWTAVPPAESGLYLDGQVRALEPLRLPTGPHLLAGRNDAPLRLLKMKR
jgi:hypothetical protein